MKTAVDREVALALLKKYNKDSFHILHGETVEKVMRYFARELGYADEVDFWGIAGLLHDVDWEEFPQMHCTKAPELLAEIDACDELIHAVMSHGFGLVCDVEPNCEMEKVLFACDELTGLIGAYARMRPNGIKDMELSGMKKKFKDKTFASGCSRDVIIKGAENLGWEIGKLIQMTMDAMAE